MAIATDVVQNQWDKVCSRIQNAESSRFAVRWLSKIIPDSIDDSGRVHLLAPSPCIHELVKKNYADQILTFWREENEFVHDIDLSLVQSIQVELPLAVSSLPETASVLPSPVSTQESDLPISPLNPNYTFDSFVVASSNQFAYAAARRIAEDDSFSFNPLYIHGGSGQGKTHLMHAIAWRMRELYPDKRVLYLSSEQFFLQFVKALQNKFEGTEHFREIFRSVDVLMIDDIQFICGKASTQEEFFNTFNYLIAHGKKIVLSADSSPQDIHYVEERLKVGVSQRLKTRMAQGLVVDILPPAYELRLGVLAQKAKATSLPIPTEVLDYLAHNIASNIRELEGALKRVIAHAELIGEAITLDTTRSILKDVLRVSEKDVSIKEIQYAVCAHYQITLSELKSVRRERRIARPRQLAMYLAKVLTPSSLPDIGYAFERDHTTVMHAVKSIENLMSRDKTLMADADLLTRRLKGDI